MILLSTLSSPLLISLLVTMQFYYYNEYLSIFELTHTILLSFLFTVNYVHIL